MMTELDGHILIAAELLKTVEFKPCGEMAFIFEWYKVCDYLYIIHDKNVDSYHFIKAETPKKALEVVLDKHANSYEFVVDDEEAGDED